MSMPLLRSSTFVMPLFFFSFMLMSFIGIRQMYPETKVAVINTKNDCNRDFLEQSSFQ